MVEAYESVRGDPVGMCFATRCTLYFEGVVEGRVFGVEGTEVGDAGAVSSSSESCTEGRLPV
jgi:hypothetical protein